MTDRRFRLPRKFSNRELLRFAPLFKGTVVNVSAGDDRDKEGKFYRQYFASASEYHITNWGGRAFRGYSGAENEIQLDLEQPLPPEFIGRFDVAFNHTTLEHIRKVELAFRNICALSRDITILIVPFAQLEHENEGYNDYWRMSPRLLRELFAESGFTVLYESANRSFNASTYLFFVASKKPDAWVGVLPEYRKIDRAGLLLGEPWYKFLAKRMLGRNA